MSRRRWPARGSVSTWNGPGCWRARDRLAGHLSGGMRQKLGVIAAMLHQPALLVLDEPTTGVDPVSRADLWSLIARAAAEGAAVVFATSYLDEAERAAHVLVLAGGRELAAGSPEQIVAAMPGRLRRPARGRPGRPGRGRGGATAAGGSGSRTRPPDAPARPGRPAGPARPAGRGHGRDPGPRASTPAERPGLPAGKEH